MWDVDTDEMPIVFMNSAGKLDMTDANVVKAYVYDTSWLNLEEAAKIAAAQDADSEINFMASFIDMQGAVLSIQ